MYKLNKRRKPDLDISIVEQLHEFLAVPGEDVEWKEILNEYRWNWVKTIKECRYSDR